MRYRTSYYIDGNTVRKHVQPEKSRVYKPSLREKEQRINDLEIAARNRRLTRNSISMTLGAMISMSIMTLMFMFVIYRYVNTTISIDNQLVKIEQQKKKLSSLKSENDNLKLSLTCAVDPEKIFKEATEELGMVYADGSQTIIFQKSETPGYVRQYDDIPK